MEEQLVKIMIEEYKERGIDVTAVIDNPLFKDLTLSNKVSLLKQFASHISSNTSKSLTKKEIGSLVFDAGFSGVTAGALAFTGVQQAAKYFNKPMIPLAAVAIPVALGTAASSIRSYLGAKKYIKNRQNMVHKFEQLAKDPSDENALRVLINRQGQLGQLTMGGGATSNAANNVKGTIGQIPGIVNKLIEPQVYQGVMAHNYVHNTNYKDGIQEHDVEKAFEDSTKNTHNTFQDIIADMKYGLFGTN